MGKKLRKYIVTMALVLTMAMMQSTCTFAATSDNNFILMASAPSSQFLGKSVTLSFSSRVTGGSSSPVSYSARFVGSATGKWNSTNKCNSINRSTSFKTSGIGGLSCNKSGPSISVSGGTLTHSLEYSNDSKFHHAYDLTVKRINICWVTQSVDVEYLYGSSSKSLNCSADKVFW